MGHTIKEVGQRNARRKALFTQMFDEFFSPNNGIGRDIEPWANRNDGIKKFQKVLTSAITTLDEQWHNVTASAQAPNVVQILAHELAEEMETTTAAHQSTAAARAQAVEHRASVLNAAQGSMGLNPPTGLGQVALPSLPFQLNPAQQAAVNQLARQTRSPDDTSEGTLCSRCIFYFYLYHICIRRTHNIHV